MSMRWALRFWPDTRKMVDDIIGMAPPNHGTTAATALCREGLTSCTPALWQQDARARFIEALNSRAETFRGISYTNTFTRTDEEVQPSLDAETAASSLHTGEGAITNIAVQDVCPTDVYEHNFHGTVDPVTYALVLDALDNPGPAKPERVPRRYACSSSSPGSTRRTRRTSCSRFSCYRVSRAYCPGPTLRGRPRWPRSRRCVATSLRQAAPRPPPLSSALQRHRRRRRPPQMRLRPRKPGRRCRQPAAALRRLRWWHYCCSLAGRCATG